MELLKNVIGEQNVSNIMLDFFDDLSQLEIMHHKLVNISEESDAKRIPGKTMGILKALSSCAAITSTTKRSTAS
jgi:phage/plasmid-associated DNA primase